MTTDLPPLQVAARAARVRDDLRERTAESACDALLVTDLTNIRWLTGFTGSNGWVVLHPDDMVLVTDGRYAEQARAQLAGHGVEATVVEGRTMARARELVREAVDGVRALGFEAEHVSYAEHRAWHADLAPSLVPTTGVIERHRRIKDEGEIARIARACAIADAALADCLALVEPGVSEAQLRNALDARARELGAEGPSYDTIVATGPSNAPLPHHRPTPTVIEEGHNVIVDVGALYDGYHSDMTRTFVVGEPTPLQAEVYAVVLAAQCAGLDAVRAGARGAEVDAVCRDAITAAGFGPWFSHGTGHGVGLLIHEDPYLGSTVQDALQPGDVVTVEPGVYRGDFGGVRVEDLVVVTTDGCRILTKTPKDTPCLPSPPTT